MSRALTLVLLSLLTAASLAAQPQRVTSLNWKRWVDGSSVARCGSDKRVFWPGWDRERIQKAIESERADPRGWKPKDGRERYWVVLSDGSEVELALHEWTKLEIGSELGQ